MVVRCMIVGVLISAIMVVDTAVADDAPLGAYSLENRGSVEFTINGKKQPSCGPDAKATLAALQHLKVTYSGDRVMVNGDEWKVVMKRADGVEAMRLGDDEFKITLIFWRTTKGQAAGALHYERANCQQKRSCVDRSDLKGVFST